MSDKRRILVAEHDRVLRREIGAVLVSRGHDVVLTGSGRTTLKTALAASPDLILLDPFKSRLQGLELLRLLRADAATAGIPVVIMGNLKESKAAKRTRPAGTRLHRLRANACLERLGQIVDHLTANGVRP